MNRFLELLISPILSLYSTSFYKRKLNESLKRGFIYLAYISLIGAFSFLIMFQTRAMPILNEMAGWLSHEMPEMIIEQGKVSSSVAQPYIMKHPKFGNVMILDSNKESLKPDEMSQAFIYITKSLIYVHNPVQNDTQTIDLRQVEGQTKPQGKTRKPEKVNGALVQAIYTQIKPVLSVVFFFTVLLSLFLWKLGAAFSYSAIAIILNLFREKQLPYPALLNVTIYAMTAVSVLQLMSLVTQSIRFDVQPWIAIGITTVYLCLAFFIALPEEKEGHENLSD